MRVLPIKIHLIDEASASTLVPWAQPLQRYSFNIRHNGVGWAQTVQTSYRKVEPELICGNWNVTGEIDIGTFLCHEETIVGKMAQHSSRRQPDKQGHSVRRQGDAMQVGFRLHVLQRS